MRLAQLETLMGTLAHLLHSAAGAGFAFVALVASSEANAQWQRLVHPDARDRDVFGQALAATGSHLVVGARLRDSGTQQDRGTAYAFTRNNGSWQFSQELPIPALTGIGQLGFAVCMSGNVAVVTAPFTQSVSTRSGAAIVYVREDDIWRLNTTLQPDDGVHSFGWSCALDESHLAIGAPFGASNTGTVFVYGRLGKQFVRTSVLQSPNGQPDDNFGSALQISEDVLLASASGRRRAYVFDRAPNGWLLRATLRSQDSSTLSFGSAIVITPTYFAVGEPDENIGTTPLHGSVYLFPRTVTGTSVGQRLLAESGPYLRLGSSLGAMGSQMAVGSMTFANLAIPLPPGRIDVYDMSAATPALRASYAVPGLRPADAFGLPVVLGEFELFAGAGNESAGNGDAQGAAYVFPTGASTQIASVPANSVAVLLGLGLLLLLAARSRTGT